MLRFESGNGWLVGANATSAPELLNELHLKKVFVEFQLDFQSPWKEFCWLASKLAPIQPPVFFPRRKYFATLARKKENEVKTPRKKDSKKEKEERKEGR